MKTDSGSSEQGRSQLDTHVCSFDSNVARLVQLLISGGIVLKARAPLSIKLLLVQSCPLHMLPPAACLAWILSNEPRLEIKWTLPEESYMFELLLYSEPLALLQKSPDWSVPGLACHHLCSFAEMVSCWVGSALSLPVDFSSNLKK